MLEHGASAFFFSLFMEQSESGFSVGEFFLMGCIAIFRKSFLNMVLD